MVKLASILLAFSFAGSALSLDAPAIEQVRFGGAEGETRIVIETSDPAAFEAFTIAEPSMRLVIDLPRTAWAVAGLETGEGLGYGLVEDFRFFDRSDEASRLVFELANPAVIAGSFAIEANADNPNHRLVVDLRQVDAREFETESGFPETSDLGQLISERHDATFASPPPERYTIVIDAGHGGHDPGALGAHAEEADVNLAAALELRRQLLETGRYNVVMTRDNDTFLDLPGRVEVARQANADLFISLHADSASSSARGAAVYTLSDSGAGRAQRLASNSNDWSHVTSSGAQQRVVQNILLSLSLRDKRNQSAVFAELVLDHMSDVSPILSNGHRQRGFYVLLDSQVPAVLVEMGFLSNRQDEANLRSPDFRRSLMRAVANSVDAYFARDAATGARASRAATITPTP